MTRAAILAVALAPAGPAMADESGVGAMDPEARRALEEGLAHFEREEFELAIARFRGGYEIEPRREFLFALGQAERLSGDCPSALVYYRRFLETEPSERQAEAARTMLDRCERALESGPSEAAAPDAPPPEEAAAVVGEQGSEPELAAAEAGAPAGGAAWYEDPLTDTLLAGGAVGLAAGIGFFISSSVAAGDARAADSYGGYERNLQAAKSRSRAGWILVGAGAGLAAGAAYRIIRHQRERRGPEVSVSAEEGAAGLLVRGEF